MASNPKEPRKMLLAPIGTFSPGENSEHDENEDCADVGCTPVDPAASPLPAEPLTRRSYPVCEVCESEIERDEHGDYRHKNQMQPFADTTYLCDRYGYPTRPAEPQKEE